MTIKKFSVAERLGAMGHALDGIVTLFKTQINAWIYLVVMILLIAAGWAAGFNGEQWILLLIVAGGVWALELVNTAVEFVCDLVSPEYHELIKYAKDTASAAVFVAGFVAVVVILWLFWSALTGPA